MLVCTRCGGAPAGMIPVPDEGYVCAPCLLGERDQFMRMIEDLKGSPMVRGVEAIGLRYSVTQGKWFIAEEEERDPEDVDSEEKEKEKALVKKSSNLTRTLLDWREHWATECEQHLRKVVEYYEAAAEAVDCPLMAQPLEDAIRCIRAIDDKKRKEEANGETGQDSSG